MRGKDIVQTKKREGVSDRGRAEERERGGGNRKTER